MYIYVFNMISVSGCMCMSICVCDCVCVSLHLQTLRHSLYDICNRGPIMYKSMRKCTFLLPEIQRKAYGNACKCYIYIDRKFSLLFNILGTF